MNKNFQAFWCTQFTIDYLVGNNDAPVIVPVADFYSRIVVKILRLLN